MSGNMLKMMQCHYRNDGYCRRLIPRGVYILSNTTTSDYLFWSCNYIPHPHITILSSTANAGTNKDGCPRLCRCVS